MPNRSGRRSTKSWQLGVAEKRWREANGCGSEAFADGGGDAASQAEERIQGRLEMEEEMRRKLEREKE